MTNTIPAEKGCSCWGVSSWSGIEAISTSFTLRMAEERKTSSTSRIGKR